MGRSNTTASGPSSFVALDLGDTLTALLLPRGSEGKQAHRTEVNLLFEGHWFGFSSVKVAPCILSPWVISHKFRDQSVVVMSFVFYRKDGNWPDGGRCTQPCAAYNPGGLGSDDTVAFFPHHRTPLTRMTGPCVFIKLPRHGWVGRAPTSPRCCCSF